MDSVSQIILLQNIRKRRSEKVAKKYKQALDDLHKARREVAQAMFNKNELIQQLENTQKFISVYLARTSLNSSILSSFQVSVRIMEGRIELAESVEKEFRAVVRGCEETAKRIKEDYRRLIISCEKMALMQDLI